MIYSLPSNNLYGNVPEEIFLPDEWEVHISKINGYDSETLNDRELRERIVNPIGAPSITAVSYTHLDVYKRQVILCPSCFARYRHIVFKCAKLCAGYSTACISSL